MNTSYNITLKKVIKMPLFLSVCFR